MVALGWLLAGGQRQLAPVEPRQDDVSLLLVVQGGAGAAREEGLRGGLFRGGFDWLFCRGEKEMTSAGEEIKKKGQCGATWGALCYDCEINDGQNNKWKSHIATRVCLPKPCVCFLLKNAQEAVRDTFELFHSFGPSSQACLKA